MVAEALAGLLLEPRDVLGDLGLEAVGQLARGHVGAAGVGRDREAGRHGQARAASSRRGRSPSRRAARGRRRSGSSKSIDEPRIAIASDRYHVRPAPSATRAELREPGERAEAEPERREEAVEDDERERRGSATRAPSARPGPAASASPSLAVALRRSTCRTIRSAISSIESSETSITGQPSRRWIAGGVLEVLVDLVEARVAAVAAHQHDPLGADLGEPLRVDRQADDLGRVDLEQLASAARSPSRAARSSPSSRGSRGRSRAASSTCARRRRGRRRRPRARGRGRRRS